MRKLSKDELNALTVDRVTVLWAHTSPQDYEMSKQMLVQPVSYQDTYVLLEASHCSCYGFDDTEWEGIEYTEDELKKLVSHEVASFAKSYFN